MPVSVGKEISGGGNWIIQHICALRQTYNSDLLEVAVVCLDGEVIKPETRRDDGVTTFILPTFQKSKWNRLKYSLGIIDVYAALATNVESVINDLRPDLIQIFGFESQFIRLVGKVKVPLIVHFTGYKEAYEYKVCQMTISADIPAENDLLGKLVKLVGPKRSVSHRTSAIGEVDYAQVSFVFGRTSWDRAITRLVSPKAKYFHMDELLRDTFHRGCWSFPFVPDGDTLRLLSVGKNAAYKNIQIIYATLMLLTKYAPNINVHWSIAGLSRGQSIPKLMKTKGYSHQRVELLGFLSAYDLKERMRESHLFVLPSAIENSPNALQEAMLFGMPVLASHAGGVSSLIEDNMDGYLVNEGDPYAMAGKILEIWDDKKKMAEVGKSARLRSQKRNNPETVAKAAFKAYKEILESQES